MMKTPLTDEELMIRYQKAADETAFDELYARYSGKLYGFILKRVGYASQAEDLLQIVFMNLHKSKEKYDPKYLFAQWIYTLCRNALIDQIRQDQRRPVGGLWEDHMSVAPPSVSQELPSDLLEKLPTNHRAAIQLRYGEDLSFEEIAQRLQTSSATARQWVSRGIKRLRQVLKGEKGEF